MGLFDFLRKKNTGIESSKFNSESFQNEACAVALWKLEEKNDGGTRDAVEELKKMGLNDGQVALILKKVTPFKKNENQSGPHHKGIAEHTFLSESFQLQILDNAFHSYHKNGQDYDIVRQELQKEGLSVHQADDILAKLKIRINTMVNDFQEQLDSGVISGIKIIPNAEHTRENIDSDQVDKYIAFGAYQMDRGDLDNALELFDKAIELDPNATLAFANKGTLYTKKADNENALVFYNKALAIEPDHIQILENKMDLLFEILDEKNEKEFIDTAKTILKNDPVHPNALIYVIQYYLKENDLENALTSAKRLFANFHRETISNQLLLTVLHRLPDDRSLEEFTRFKNGMDKNAEYQLEYCKGVYLMGKKDYEKAISTFDHLNKEREFSWNYYQMAIIKNFQDKTDECFYLLRKTFELEPELKEDAKQIPDLQNLSTNSNFIELTK